MTTTQTTVLAGNVPVRALSFSTSKDLYAHFVNQLPNNVPDPTPVQFPQYATDVPGVSTTRDINSGLPPGLNPMFHAGYIPSANQIIVMDPRIGDQKVDLPGYFSLLDFKTMFTQDAQRFILDTRIEYLRSIGQDPDSVIGSFYTLGISVEEAYDKTLAYLLGGGLQLLLIGIGLIVAAVLVGMFLPGAGAVLLSKGLLLIGLAATAMGTVTFGVDSLRSAMFDSPQSTVISPPTSPDTLNCMLIRGGDGGIRHTTQTSPSGPATVDDVTPPAPSMWNQLVWGVVIVGAVIVGGVVIYSVATRRPVGPALKKVFYEYPKRAVKKVITVGRDVFGRPVQKEAEVPAEA